MKRQEYDHSKLKGVDVDLEISLKEYGLAWIETDIECLFYYGIEADTNDCGGTDYTRFDFCTFNKDLDVREEFDWVDWGVFYSTGIPEKEFNELPLTSKIGDLFYFYGYENMFGSSYWEGLTYDQIKKEK